MELRLKRYPIGWTREAMQTYLGREVTTKESGKKPEFVTVTTDTPERDKLRLQQVGFSFVVID